jgi:hypothetical protein
MKKYEMVSEICDNAFLDAINELYGDGYTPHGPMVVTTGRFLPDDGDLGVVYSQLMVLKDRENEL